MKYISYCCTCLFSLFLLFILVYLGKKQMSTLEPMSVIMTADYDSTDLLLDEPTKLKMKTTTYRQAQKCKKTAPMSSFEQTNNNQKYTRPENGSMELPELSGFY
jgi:hypothetical protein